MDFKSILLAKKTGYIPRNHFDALFARKTGGAVLKDFPGLPSSIVTVTDALAKPLNSLKVAITPVQSGSGDPSPNNIRPISGWTEANIYNSADVNFDADGNIVIESTQAGSGDPSPTNIRPITAGLSLLMDDSSTLDVYGGYLDVKSRVLTVDRKMNELSEDWVWYKSSSYAGGYFSDKRDSLGYKKNSLLVSSHAKTARSLSEYVMGTCYCDTSINFRIMSETSMLRDWKDFIVAQRNNGTPITFNYELATPQTYQLSQTEFARALTALGTTYPITFPSEAGTVYGGTLDVTNGVLTVTKANIASYDGETLPGAWISDRDVYAEGTTPTTGAQVVYDLDTPITYQLTPTEVQTLLGTNNLWADTGDILEGKYWSKNPVTVTRAMLNTLRSAGEITEITPTEEPEEI